MSDERNYKKQRKSKIDYPGSINTVFYRKDRNRWIYRFTYNGKVKELYGKTRRQAIERYCEFIYKTDTIKSEETIPGILTRYYKNEFELNRIAPSTYQRHKETTKQINNQYIGKIEITYITEDDIDKFFKSMLDLSTSTINKIYTAFVIAFKTAYEEKTIEKNFMKDYKKPISNKQTKEMIALTVSEHKRFLEVIETSRYYMQFLIAINTGARIGEINALHIKDIDFIANTITINKTVSKDDKGAVYIKETPKTKAGQRIIFMNDLLKEPLKEYCKYFKGYLFLINDKPLRSNAIYQELQLLNYKYNIRAGSIPTHILRHTFITRAIERGHATISIKRNCRT